MLQISANLADRESRHLAAADTVKKAEERLQPVKVGLVFMFHFINAAVVGSPASCLHCLLLSGVLTDCLHILFLFILTMSLCSWPHSHTAGLARPHLHTLQRPIVAR